MHGLSRASQEAVRGSWDQTYIESELDSKLQDGIEIQFGIRHDYCCLLYTGKVCSDDCVENSPVVRAVQL